MEELKENISNQDELVNPFLSEEEISSEESTVSVPAEEEEAPQEAVVAEDETDEEEEESVFKSKIKAVTSSVRMAFTGEILREFSESKAFSFMIAVIAVFICNIFFLFLSFKMINNSEKLAQEVQILKNKSTLLHEQYLRVTSQSAIREEVARRKIRLIEPDDPQKKY